MEACKVEPSTAQREQTERVLVDQAREYLRQRLSKLAPDAVLTQAWDVFYQTYTGVLRRMAAEFHLELARVYTGL